MIRQSLAILALATITGCSAGGSFQPLSMDSGSEAKLAAYAASTHYPTDTKAMGDLRVGAIVNDDGKIKCVNFTDHPIRDAKLWVNGNFVYHVENLPAHGSVSINYDELFDSGGHTFASTKVLPNKIEVQTGDGLFSLYSAAVR